MSVINQSDIEHIDEALRKFANQKNMNGFAAILIGFTDDGDHTCLIAKGELAALLSLLRALFPHGGRMKDLMGRVAA